jgi:uncharacterized radical SAM superfamily Fe-S cluster-containing enzyme
MINEIPIDDRTTASLCPVCLERIPARRVARGDEIFLEKRCPTHGTFQTLIWKGAPPMAAWSRPKIPSQPAVVGHAVENGCPFDCGLCVEHRQRSCTVILEVTRRCDMGCRVCYADSRPEGCDPTPDTVSEWYRRAGQSSGACNIQLSGGEPTLRDDLPDLVYMGRRMGFNFIQINTNGLRLAREPGYAATLKHAGAASIFLQFDGVDDTVYRSLRGRPLWSEKQAAVAACAKAGLGVVLVPTLVPGTNTRAIGDILRAALQWYPAVRGVHFQPVSYFGRHPGAPADHDRLTLPELMQLIENQSEGLFRADHFSPPGCEHSLCSFHAQYLVDEDCRPRPLHPLSNSWRGQAPIQAEEGASRAIASVARQWAGPPSEKVQRTPVACGCSSTAGCANDLSTVSLDDFLAITQAGTFSVSAMAFQDVWNLDLERVQQCCIHIMAPDGRLVPFCLYNLTAAGGRTIYRS